MDVEKSPNLFLGMLVGVCILVPITVQLGHVTTFWIFTSAILFLLWVYVEFYIGSILRIKDGYLEYSVGLLTKKYLAEVSRISRIEKTSMFGLYGGTTPAITIFHTSGGKQMTFNIIESRYIKNSIGELISKLVSINPSIEIDSVYKDSAASIEKIIFFESKYEKERPCLLLKSLLITAVTILTYILVSELLH